MARGMAPLTIDPGLRIGSEGRYELRHPVICSRSSILYDGIDHLLARRVAIKQLQSSSIEERTAERPGQIEEARLIASLGHPLIVQIYDICSDGTNSFIVMEFLEGVTLDAFCRKAPLSQSRVMHVLDQLLEALSHTHAREILHRDLKPANVFVRTDGRVCLLDFSLSRRFSASDASLGAPAADALCGSTPAWLAPECWAGAAPGVASELWSVGMIALELLIGRHPVQTGPLKDMHQQILHLDVAWLLEQSDLWKGEYDVQGWRSWLKVALAINPQERFEDAQSMRKALARAMGRNARAIARSKRVGGSRRAPRISSVGAAFDRQQRPPASQLETSSLWSRLDRLGSARELARAAAVFEAPFPLSFLEALMGRDAEALEHDVQVLITAGVWGGSPGGASTSYRFVQPALRDSLRTSWTSGERVRLHRRAAETLTHLDPDGIRAHPEWLALHRSGAGEGEQAIDLWMAAAENCAQQWRIDDAKKCLDAAQLELDRLSEGPLRDHRELTLQVARGSLCMAEGFASLEVHAVYRRALEVCRRLGSAIHLDQVSHGLMTYLFSTRDFPAVEEIGQQLIETAARTDGWESRIVGAQCLGLSAVIRGHHAEGLKWLKQARGDYQHYGKPIVPVEYGYDVGCSIQLFGSWACLYGGDLSEGERWLNEGLALAREVEHPASMVYSLALGAAFWLKQGRAQEGMQLATTGLELCRRHDQPFWVGWLLVLEGWAALQHGDLPTSEIRWREGSTLWARAGMGAGRALFSEVRCHILLAAGRDDEVLEEVNAALSELEFYQDHIGKPALLCMGARALSKLGRMEEAWRMVLEAECLARAQQAWWHMVGVVRVRVMLEGAVPSDETLELFSEVRAHIHGAERSTFWMDVVRATESFS